MHCPKNISLPERSEGFYCKLILLKLIITVFLVMAIGCSSNSNSKNVTAQQLYSTAKEYDDQWMFTMAGLFYDQARVAFLSEGKTSMVQQCRNDIQRIVLFNETYPYTEDRLREIIRQKFPGVPAARLDGWFADESLEHIKIDGVKKYMNDQILGNIKYRNLDLFRADDAMVNGYRNLVALIMDNYADTPRPEPVALYTNPKSFRAQGTLSIPRDQLPATGTLRIWFPLPISSDSQQAVTIDEITPNVYVKGSPGGEDIGLAYMEVPLAELTGDLKASVTFSFNHYEQYFTIDPAMVGAYDTTGSDYVRYTRSYGNTTITPEIRETALRVVGGETNPCLAARKLYYYVVDNITYSLPPATLWPYGQPASVYVHQNRIGDCGCQSIYFSALCRSIGIPARATGGKQMFSGSYSDHFWAEFFLPNYGWVPVDTSVAQMEWYVPGLSDAVRKAYREYFFGHQDNLRLIIQKDVDEPVFPAVAGGMLYCSGAVQNPDGTCDTMDTNVIAGELIQKYWKLVEKPYTGWAIGNDPDQTAVILHTADGGASWAVQGQKSQWTGYNGTDISAVDRETSWAALASGINQGGMILHTRDGGSTWTAQRLPQVIPQGVKGIKGVSRNEAWAVGLNGPVLHTTDGGETWGIIPTPGITLRQVNRIDVLGKDIWIADHGSGENGMIHSPDGGQTWRQEYLPGVEAGHGPMTASIVNSRVAWTSVNMQGELYRTLDGGITWRIDAPGLSGPNDIDDTCAVGEDAAWAVQNTSGGGHVMRVKIAGSEVVKSNWYFPNYVYEGIAAVDAQRAWIGGYRGMSVPTNLPKGSILHTGDGGETWVSQTLPVHDVDIWKISFVGARR